MTWANVSETDRGTEGPRRRAGSRSVPPMAPRDTTAGFQLILPVNTSHHAPEQRGARKHSNLLGISMVPPSRQSLAWSGGSINRLSQVRLRFGEVKIFVEVRSKRVYSRRGWKGSPNTVAGRKMTEDDAHVKIEEMR